jgi:uracil phosphoribosyltransferase
MTEFDTLTIVTHPLVQHKLSLMRDKNCASQDFARLLTEISMLMAYEVTRDLAVTTTAVETPLEVMDTCREKTGFDFNFASGQRNA